MDDPPLRRIIRLCDLPLYVGLQRTQIDKLIKNGELPSPVRLSDSGRAKGIFSDELAEWQRKRIEARARSQPRKRLGNGTHQEAGDHDDVQVEARRESR